MPSKSMSKKQVIGDEEYLRSGALLSFDLTRGHWNDYTEFMQTVVMPCLQMHQQLYIKANTSAGIAALETFSKLDMFDVTAITMAKSWKPINYYNRIQYYRSLEHCDQIVSPTNKQQYNTFIQELSHYMLQAFVCSNRLMVPQYHCETINLNKEWSEHCAGKKW